MVAAVAAEIGILVIVVVVVVEVVVVVVLVVIVVVIVVAVVLVEEKTCDFAPFWSLPGPLVGSGLSGLSGLSLKIQCDSEPNSRSRVPAGPGKRNCFLTNW